MALALGVELWLVALRLEPLVWPASLSKPKPLPVTMLSKGVAAVSEASVVVVGVVVIVVVVVVDGHWHQWLL